MKSAVVLLTILLSLSFALASSKAGTARIINLKTSNTDQLGVFFSWESTTDQRGWTPTAYQIQLAASPENLKSGHELIWDSGKIISEQSNLVYSKGLSLKAGQTYFWKVKVWNSENRETEWSEPVVYRTGLSSEADWRGAKWIGYDDLPAEKKMIPGVHGNGDKLGELCVDRPVVPLFRKEFEVSKKVKEAVLYITGLGQYEASINGQKVGNSFLSPGWTNYDKTILYNSFDVTSMLRQGKNAVGAIVGNGFYNINRERYRKLVIAWGNPKLIGQLRIRYADGAEQFFVTGADWKTAPSPITFTSIYGGEDYDARLEQSGWNAPNFDERAWKQAILVTAPTGKLVEEYDSPLEIKETFSAKSVKKLGDGNYQYDFGQNASGIVELKVKGKKGQEVRLTPSELIKPDGQPNQSATGSPTYFSYILKGDGIETWRPRFSYTGFRYVKVEGAAPESEKQAAAVVVDLKLLHNRNSTPQTGTFACSNDLFNRTFTLINWGIKSNLQSVLTDCPHREKLGWLEQTFLMGSAVHYNFDLYQLYTKQVNDMIEAQLPDGLVPDIAPEYVPFAGGFRDSPEWGSAAVILPWMIYRWYGDASVMEKAWPMMNRYAEYLKSKSENHIVSHGLGDWFDLGPKQPGEAQLTPKSLTATAIYYSDLKLLAEMAGVLKKSDEQKKLLKWANEIKTAFNAKFFNPETGIISTGSQTAMAMPWCVGLVDDQYKEKVMQNLEKSIREQGKPLTAGDVGFHYLVEALTNSGRSQLLFEMNNRDDVPGYGFQLKKGATALTESWPALENVSNNHLMLGHLMDWFYAGLGGIGQTENSVAYKEIAIKPEMVGDLTWVKSSYQSPYGEIRSDWEKTNAGLKMNVSVPANTTALVYVPAKSASEIKEGGKVISVLKDIQVVGQNDGRIILKVGSGKYLFTTTKN
jgi:Glycogen debranching enzyme